MSFATRIQDTPNGIVDLRDASADDDSTPRSSSVEDNPNVTMEVPFHGSCPKCHHLHTNSPFTIFTDPTKHSRFQCDACKHHILGIGRASTQTTLASVESIPVQSNRHSVTSRPSNLQICINASPPSTVNSPTSPDELNTPTHLSTIAEANTLNGESRSPSYRQARLSISPQRGNSPSLRASLKDKDNMVQRESGKDGESPTRPPSRFRLRALFRRGKARLLAKSRELKIFGFNIKITKARPKDLQDLETPDHKLTIVKSSPANVRTARVRSRTDDGQSPGRSAPNPPSPVADTSEEPPDHSSEEVRNEIRPTNPQQSDPAVNSVEAEADADEDQRAAFEKREKIRARRREATLKNEAAWKPYCHCRVGCPCLGDGGESDGTSEGHVAPSSLPVSEVPDHPIIGFVTESSRSSNTQTSHGNARLLSEIGSHIHPNQMYAHRQTLFAENSSSGGDSNIRQVNRLSQDTTTWGSNSSSISLTARRSSPGPSSVMALPSHRSSGPTAVQNYEEQSRYHGPSRDRGSAELPASESDVAPTDPNPGISEETLTGLVNLTNLRAEQESRHQLSDGTSISSDDTLEQLENEERTPRALDHNVPANDSPNAVSEPSPEGLSTALADLSERQTAI